MSAETEKIKKVLDTVSVNREMLNKIIKDRMDFGFDSIYFRYAIVRDELAEYKARHNRTDIETEKSRANADKMRFYAVLEQLTQAHEECEL